MTRPGDANKMTMQREVGRGPVRAALISVDEDFRTRVSTLVGGTEGRVEVGLETSATPAALLRDPATPLRDYDPQLLFLELGPEPEDGIRLAGVLSRAHPGIGILASGEGNDSYNCHLFGQFLLTILSQ